MDAGESMVWPFQSSSCPVCEDTHLCSLRVMGTFIPTDTMTLMFVCICVWVGRVGFK